MALDVSVQVFGVKELDAALRELPPTVAGPIMFDALTAGGEVIRRATIANIHSRSGRTAADIRVEVQNDPERTQGAAAVGGTRRGKTSRGYILRFLEFGTKPHVIVGGATDRRQLKKASRALGRIGRRDVAAVLRSEIKAGNIVVRKNLKFAPGVYRRIVKHPGFANQSPLTRALADNVDRLLEAFKATLWDGIANYARNLHGPGF